LAVFRTNQTVGDYDFGRIVSYYLLVPVIGGFTSIFVSEHLPRKIKDGAISIDLLKPYSISAINLLNQFGIKLTQLTIKLPAYLFAGIFFTHFFNIHLQLIYLPLALFICIFSYLLHFYLDLALSYLAFWVDDTWSFGLIKTVALMVFGGLSFPLDLVPQNFRLLFDLLPFKYIYFYPVKVAQGGMPANQLVSQLVVLLTWLVFFFILGKLLWFKGIRKYGAYGN